MRIYHSDALYTLIPKNACSTLRFSIALANGCVSDISDVNWIHENNNSFNATTETAATTAYSFVILRCPFSRLYSAYMDKIVGLKQQGWGFQKSCDFRFDLYDLTFKAFIHELGRAPMGQMDIHWRAQNSFLLFDDYDDYFAFEDFSNISAEIEQKAGFEICDTRQALGHDVGGVKDVLQTSEPFNMAGFDLLGHKKAGRVPDPKTMFDAEMIATIRRVYAGDFQLYTEKFGKSVLMKAFS